jgi:hypothetical protein
MARIAFGESASAFFALSRSFPQPPTANAPAASVGQHPAAAPALWPFHRASARLMQIARAEDVEAAH